jgi:hypothetical protein
MTDPAYLHVEYGGILAATVNAYPTDGVERFSLAAQDFQTEAKARLAPGMAMTAGGAEPPVGVIAPLVTFYFGPAHIPLPMEEILEWLRGHPLVRVIEIERHRIAAPAT